MIEFTQHYFNKVFDIVKKVPFNNYFARVVLENKIEGRVFADNESSPEVCFIIHKYGMALLCGRTDIDSFNLKLVSFLKNDSINHGYAKWILVHPETEWQNKISELLGDTLTVKPDIIDSEILKYKKEGKILQTVRVNFKFDKNIYNSKYQMPDGFRIERVSPSIYSRISGSVVPSYYWKDAEDFLANGIGYSMLSSDDEVVCVCFTSFIVDDKYELGIETAPKFRGRGYAIYPVCAMIDFCLSHNFEPVWGCRKENTSSFKLAEKAGFRPHSYHPYYTLPVI